MSSPVPERRVVVTGLGAVTSIGFGVTEFLAGLRAGRDAAKPIRSFDTTGFVHAQGCEITDFEADRFLRNLPRDEFGRASGFAAAAARMAVEDGGMRLDDLRDARSLVAIGTTDGESRDLEDLVRLEIAGGFENLDPGLARRVPAGRLSVAVAYELGLTDVEAVTMTTACAAGNYAVGHGLDAIRNGDVDFALCGGADALCLKTLAGFTRLGVVASDHCRPFDRDREGMLPGEGSGVLLLESLESARRRGARVYAEVLGYGLNCDATHAVSPDEESFADCMRLALEDAGIEPGDVDLISAHGTGTPANDVTEARAINRVFAGDPPPTVAVKSMIGHTMGAASALASVACALAIREGFAPPTINHRETDPECAVDCVPNAAVDMNVRIVQNNALAFGGNNAVVILGIPDDSGRGSRPVPATAPGGER
ncbi:beta-ketoacyl-[acyl-carrier-protein] synthase family protein [Streptomyces sp. NPDC053048]|uniref:beta-ketoacyl-[acyl-carrier-protein] synthase family protein n=1 Tax=Streptomyces sp. NPDC053048 TaxID=3365694 RepID=UPI0037CD2ECA